MTATVEPNPEATRPELTENGEGGRGPSLFGGRYGTTSLRVGAASIWLSVIVLLPLAAIVWHAHGWDAITTNQAIASLKLTLSISLVVALVNAIAGTAIAWTLVRDRFPGQNFLNALVDLPFALPTIVAGLVLLTLYRDLAFTRWAILVALLFVTFPFVVRTVQPVLL